MQGMAQASIDGLQAAAALLAERGYAGVRAEELARVAGVSVGSLYRRHGSKAGIAAAVRTLAAEDLVRVASQAWRFSWDPARAVPADFCSAFLTLWHAMARWAVEQPALFDFTFLHRHPQAEPTDGPSAQPVLDLLHEVLDTGRALQVVQTGPTWVVAGVVWGTLLEVVRSSHARGAALGEAELTAAGEAVWCALRKEPRSGGVQAPAASGAATVAPGAERGGGGDGAASACEELGLRAPLRSSRASAPEAGPTSSVAAPGDAPRAGCFAETPSARAQALAEWRPCCPCATWLRPQADLPPPEGRPEAPASLEADAVGEPPPGGAALGPALPETSAAPARAAALAFHAAWRTGMRVEPSVILGHMAALGFDADCEADVRRAYAETERGALDFDFVQRWFMSGLLERRDREWARTRELLRSTGSTPSPDSAAVETTSGAADVASGCTAPDDSSGTAT